MKMKESLYVEIPKRFKESIQRKFDLRRAKKIALLKQRLDKEYTCGYKINAKCSLCEEYEYREMNCKQCPFGRFGNGIGGSSLGCRKWVAMVLDMSVVFELWYTGIFWGVDDDKEAREQIKNLKKKAKRYIRWV